MTREAIAEALEESLVYDPQIEQAIRERFQQLGKEMPEINLRQCQRFENATVLSNPYGTAPGLFWKKTEKFWLCFQALPVRCIRCFKI